MEDYNKSLNFKLIVAGYMLFRVVFRGDSAFVNVNFIIGAFALFLGIYPVVFEKPKLVYRLVWGGLTAAYVVLGIIRYL